MGTIQGYLSGKLEFKIQVWELVRGYFNFIFQKVYVLNFLSKDVILIKFLSRSKNFVLMQSVFLLGYFLVVF